MNAPPYFTESSLAAYLDDHHGGGEPWRVAALTGGVSALVFLCESAGVRWVVKQAREFLAVREEWRAPRERLLNECEAMRRLAPFLPQGQVPPVVFEAPELFTYGMKAAAPAARPLKEWLLNGEWRPEWVESCGALLGRIHKVTAEHESSFRERFGDLALFEALRLDPYFRFAAMANPKWTGRLELAAELARRPGCALVHGDFSPKNILLDPANPLPVLLDYEVAHWGEPAFDVGFFLTHLAAKAIARPDERQAFRDAAERFLAAYEREAGPLMARPKGIRLHWACIMMARADGKSPLEYLDETQKAKLRAAAGRLWDAPDGAGPEWAGIVFQAD